MITRSESDEETTGGVPGIQESAKDDPNPPDVEAASTSLPAKNLTLAEDRARAQAAKAASQKRADEGAVAKKHTAPKSPLRGSPLFKGYHDVFGDSDFDEEEEEGVVYEPLDIFNGLEKQQEIFYQAVLQQGSLRVTPSAPSTPVYPRGYYPQEEETGYPVFLGRLKAPRGAPMNNEQIFVDDIDAARCVLLAPHRIPLKEFAGLRKTELKNITTQSQAEDLFWRWVSLKNFTVQELKELREDHLLFYVLDQRAFALGLPT
ncbi:ATP-binding cassette (ABC) Superfamily [Phytophthora palmivora]|uniref:ATP-binding cassette (ABC) Superfamily n=1 Tax=Phytophthora palmivora TaxID=4796 RepID=A0A2P4X4L8_9STRA|nr:ATP-binding cassette (ABC) Superfamily [Phytophthora palmivora]